MSQYIKNKEDIILRKGFIKLLELREQLRYEDSFVDITKLIDRYKRMLYLEKLLDIEFEKLLKMMEHPNISAYLDILEIEEDEEDLLDLLPKQTEISNQNAKEREKRRRMSL